MGYNTTVFILNDGFGELEKHPAAFVEGINRAMHEGGTVAVGNHLNCVEVMPTQHADVFRLYASQGNAMVELSPWSRATMDLATTHPDYLRSVIKQAKRLLRDLEREFAARNTRVPASGKGAEDG